MIVEDHNALRFILQDEIYLLDEDKSKLNISPIAQPVLQTQLTVFNYFGSNKKQFLILVNYSDQEFMQAEHLAALESVLGRLDHTRDDVAILNLSKHADTSYEQLAGFFKPKSVVILGRNAVPTGSDPKFNTIEQTNGIKTLLTFAFDEMMMNVDNKKAFWEQMKNL